MACKITLPGMMFPHLHLSYRTKVIFRYNHEYEDTDDDDDRAFSRGRVNVPHPRTPGGRVARSMDIEREFMLDSSFDALRLATIRSSETGTAI